MGWKEGNEKSVNGYIKNLWLILFLLLFLWGLDYSLVLGKAKTLFHSMGMPRSGLWKWADVLSHDMPWSLKSLGRVLWPAHVRAWLKAPGLAPHTLSCSEAVITGTSVCRWSHLPANLPANPTWNLSSEAEERLLPPWSSSLQVYLEWSNWKKLYLFSTKTFVKKNFYNKTLTNHILFFLNVVIRCGRLTTYSKNTHCKANYMTARTTQFLLDAMEISHTVTKLTF